MLVTNRSIYLVMYPVLKGKLIGDW